MRNVYLFVGLLVCSCISLSAQDSIATLSLVNLEDLFENNDEQSYDFFSLYDELQAYLKNPININTATAEDLRSMQMLSEVQVQDILSHREDFGDYLSVYELQSIPSLDVGTLRALVPLTRVTTEKTTNNIGDLFSGASSDLFLKWKRVLEDREGFNPNSTNPYEGDPNHLALRFQVSNGTRMRMGLIAEKDPGEAFFRGSNPNGFDYYSAFFFVRDIHPRIAVLSLGDYNVSMGQGLILHNSFGGGKSSNVMDVKKGGRVFRPYSSVNENNFFRGGAATINLLSNTQLSLFYSSKRIDGNVQIDTMENEGFERFSSIIVDGFHRTATQIERENSLSQNSMGGVLKYQKRNFSIAANLLREKFSSSRSPGEQLYNKFRFQGDELLNTSVDFSYRYKNINTFGEFARSGNGGLAYLQGLLLSAGRNVDVSVVYRNFARDYQVLFGNAFSESTFPINERGIYMGVTVRPSSQWRINTYFDFFKTPWVSFRRDAPAIGKEFLFRVDYTKKRRFNIYFQYRYENKYRNETPANAVVDFVEPGHQHRARFHIENRVTKELKLRNRIEISNYRIASENSSGLLIFQDVIYKPVGKPYSFSARYQIFDIPDFDARIYAFENDIRYEFAIPFFVGSGKRYYINLKNRFNRHITAEFRFGRVIFDDADRIIGSSGETINGRSRTELKAQIRYKF